ncbi:hypothetical protein BBJ28_00018059 [Nothophytophthora sp. Chile5]|nr:hypothetical protein BBJ28_00018059 [Nothophytophthora sp. Chile5]
MNAHKMLAAKVEKLLARIAARGARSPPALPSARPFGEPVRNVVAFSGGVDSSLAAALVQQVFPTTSAACIGRSAALSATQLQQARDVAAHIGLPLWECRTEEAKLEGYVANQGKSCYYCKTTLYATLNQVAAFTWQKMQQHDGNDNASTEELKPVLYNGTNADDQLDPTRFDVVSPLSELTKQEVRDVAKYLGLPNWNAAASPCLRSRLQFGVEATQDHLHRVERAEDFVRELVQLETHMNMRVRFLAGNRAAVGTLTLPVTRVDRLKPNITMETLVLNAELDNEALKKAMPQSKAIDAELRRFGRRLTDLDRGC